MSWYQLLDVVRQAQEELDAEASRAPSACPKDGEPLIKAPPTDAGSGMELFCPVDGWQYPRDWVRPERL